MRFRLQASRTTASTEGDQGDEPRPRVPRPDSLVRMTGHPARSQGEVVQQYQCHQPEKAHKSFGKTVEFRS